MVIKDVTQGMSPEDLRLLQQWAGAEIARLRANPLEYGPPPHPGQERFLLSTALLVLLVSANRWGKTNVGIRECLFRARGNHPYKKTRPCDVIWVGFPDYRFFKRVTEPTFLQLCPPDWLLEYNKTEKWAKIRREDGGVCTIFFMSYDMPRDSWQGASVDFMWLDEECPEDLWREAMARLIDKSGTMAMTLTPVSGMGWIYDRLFLPAVNELRRPLEERDIDLVQGALATRDPSQPYEVGEPLVPHLTKAQIIRFASSIADADERSIRVFGEFRARSGAVYKQYKPEIHLVPQFTVPKHWDVWCGVDPGYHGFAVIFLTQSPTGRLYVVDEYFSQEESTRLRAAAIWRRYLALRAPGLPEEAAKAVLKDDYLVLYVDTEDPQLVLEMNIWASENNVPVVFNSLDQGKKARKAGITRVQNLLHPNPERTTPKEVLRPRPADGEPTLYIFDSLHSTWRLQSGEEIELLTGSRLTWEMSRYLWKVPPAGAPHPEDADERSAGGAHALAALRYAVMARMGAPAELEQDPLAHLSGRDQRVWRGVKQLHNRLLGYEDDA